MEIVTPKLPQNNPLATWSLVLSIFGLLLGPCCPPLMLALSVPAVICGHKARGRIQRAMTKEGAGTSVAGLVIGYVGMAVTILFIPIYLAIALPAFTKARAKATEVACQNNLRMIAAAKDQYVLDHQAEVPATLDALVDAKLLNKLPVCPAGGEYALGKISEDPTCSKHAIETSEDVLPSVPEPMTESEVETK